MVEINLVDQQAQMEPNGEFRKLTYLSYSCWPTNL